jgi:peptidoglycan/xylan/chitin deacetylase (PgdA/CDA1 family)
MLKREHSLIIILALLLILPPDPSYGQDFDGTLRRLRVPILMYHYVSPLPEDADDLRIGLSVSPEQFRAHLQYLSDNQYTSISLYEVVSALRQGTPLPERPIILTFDDGHIDHYEHVLPLLQEFGMTGTFFVITALADESNRDYLNWDQIREMAAAGMTMASHTKNHADLRGRDRSFLVYQILGSIESIDAHDSLAQRVFAYPFGRYDDAVVSMLSELEVEAVVTTVSGIWHTTSGQLELSRLRITGGLGANGLHQLLTGS